ncbi:unnamed protein product [Camellia sinensis]|uniref:Uncharacterized protein n=1 Tax=Camellia sinensis var. sinensis TaxID=542762 RepID=A0A4S4DU41_CAMSN|nr:uncharacterized protein LOC114287002 [Camellia sinensis]THG06792.1 hypothetical protein TEA_001941 [Camellia sinensis var. sinensis]
MESLISNTLNRHLIPQFSSFLFRFPSLSRENPNLLNFSHRKWLHHPKTLTFCSATASESLTYGGWDDPRLGGDSVHSGESNQLRNLLNSLGIDDKRYIFVYLLGFVCALAISRVRVSSIVVFPACAIVFAVGFSIGFVNGGHMNELSLIGTKKRPKDENLKVSIEKLRNLVDLFSGFDGKISNLKDDIRRGIECNHITVGDLEGYVKVMESIGLSALNARSVVEACIDSLLVENQEVERTSNQKSSRRRKDVGEIGFDLLQLIGGLFREKLVESKPYKMKDSFRRDLTRVELNDQGQGNVLTHEVEENVLSSVGNNNAGNGNASFFGETYSKPSREGAEKFANEARRINVLVEHDKVNFADVGSHDKRALNTKEYSYQDNRLRFVKNHRISLKMGHHNEVETWESHNDRLDSVDFDVNLKHLETQASFEQEQIFQKTNGSYRPTDKRGNNVEKEIYKSQSREDRVIPNDNPSSSSMVSDDIVFNRYLMESNALLKEARECLRAKGNEGHVEIVLHESAKLLSKAMEMKPMSLLAVGQLGNTYLLHGELKLKTSRNLRALLESHDPVSIHKQGKVLKGLEDQIASKDKIASVLVNVCEECEELLVEAGRKYRLALSIDGNDMRALYNWGLALSFRAQLIADIGPEAAFDADKVFLAAIDKFDAMMSKSNVYTPDALFRWGVALQQRSQLRPRNSKEKLKLLQQAKRLYEDALDMDSDNHQAREALCSCISELGFRN